MENEQQYFRLLPGDPCTPWSLQYAEAWQLISCPLPSLPDCIIWQSLILGEEENWVKNRILYHVYLSPSM